MSLAEEVTLVTSDNVRFRVDATVAKMSRVVAGFLDQIDDADPVVPLPMVDAPVLANVLRYCEHRVSAMDVTDDTGEWEATFILAITAEDDNFGALIALLTAANYLDIEPLVTRCADSIADALKNKDPETIRAMLGIKNDFTPEEEEEVRRENLWAFSADEK